MEAAFQSGFASALLTVMLEGVVHITLVELKKIANTNATMTRLETTVIEAQETLKKIDIFVLDIDVNSKNVLQARIEILARLCFKARDLIEDLCLKLNSSKKSMFLAFLSSPKNWGKPRKIGKLRSELDDILGQLTGLIKSLPQGNRNKTDGNCSKNIVPDLFGREGDMKEIINELISDSSKYKGVSIVGMDGLGKTALAQTIQKQREITQQFDLIRLPLNNDGVFVLTDAVIDILENHLSSRICTSFLILFDNLLKVNSDDWDKFLSYTTLNKFGGKQFTNIKILSTTINAAVPSATKTKAHNLKFLSNDDCQRVIEDKVRFYNKDEIKPRLLHAAHALAKKCEGLPSVARIIGIEIAHCDDDELTTMLTQQLWDTKVFKEKIFPALRSSYLNLQPHLKQCFAYFSLFPQKYCYDVDELVQLWVAEGFIEDAPSQSEVLQNSNMYFNDLRSKSILQITTEVTRSGHKGYILHEFSRHFSQLASSWTCQRLDDAYYLEALDPDVRHLSVSCDKIDSSTIWTKVKGLKRLRTFLSLRNRKLIGYIRPDLFKYLARLRVLSLSETDIVELPDSINKLKRLRYLDISHTSLKKLPDTLVELPRLQFLKLKKTQNLNSLPSDFQKLTNLLSVDWEIGDIRRFHLPSNIGRLSSLHTLPLFPVGKREGYSIKELHNMKSLEGSICITHLENISDKTEAEAANLWGKSSLKSIELHWTRLRNDAVAKDILTGLKLHDRLNELKITNYGCDDFPEWMCHSSLLLEKVHLKRCNVIVMPSFGKLPNLKTLIIEDFDNLEVLNFRSGEDFQSLESLEFKGLAKLREWTRLEASDMPKLGVLKISSCPMLKNLPSLRHLTSLADVYVE